MNLFLTLALRPDSLLSSAPPANLHKYLLAFKFDQIVRSSLSEGRDRRKINPAGNSVFTVSVV